MIINLDDVANAEKLNGILEENEKLISQYKENYEKLINEQEKILVTYINKVSPIINYLIDKGYELSHPSLNYFSKVGPILDYNSHNNLLYVFDIKSHIVREIKMNNLDDKKMFTLNQFVRFGNFGNAIDGILYCLKLHNIMIEQYQNEIDKKEEIISKYQGVII